MEIYLSVPKQMYEDLNVLAKEHMRSIKQEALYRLEQGMRMKKHLSENDAGILKIISSLYEAKENEK
jgi:hypothetical protein